MLPPHVLQIADAWWARDVGCDREELRPPATRVQAHSGGMRGTDGIWIIAVGPFPLVSLPPQAMETIGVRARAWTRSLVGESSTLVAELAPLAVEKVIGPAFIGYGTAQMLDLSRATRARQLAASDDSAITRLRAACGEEQWQHGGSDRQQGPVFGVLDAGGELGALAGYEVWGRELAHISIVTNPQQRGCGLGSAAVSLAALHASNAGLIPQYRTLAANAPSMGIARRLGFEEYGFSVYIRLAAAAAGATDALVAPLPSRR